MSVLCWEGEDLCQCPDALAAPAPELPPFTFSEWIDMRRALHVAKIYLGADGAYMMADALHQWLGTPDELLGPEGNVNARGLAWDRLGEAARTFGQVQWLDALEGFTLERAQASAAAERRKP
jgi:hypothetical protein